MRDLRKRNTFHQTAEAGYLTGWRWVAVVTAGSFVLLAALVILGIGVAAKMGVNVASHVATPKSAPLAAKPDNDASQESAPDAPATESAPVAAAKEAKVVTPSVDPSICENVARAYQDDADELVKTKPLVPSIGKIVSTATELIRGNYNKLASKYNDDLDLHQAKYVKDATDHACSTSASPFSVLSQASLL